MEKDIDTVEQPTKDALGGFASFDVATGKQETVGIVNDRIYFTPSWMPDGSAVVVATGSAWVGKTECAVGDCDPACRAGGVLTTDTNDYIRPMLSADGRLMVATQRQLRQEISITAADAPGASGIL